MRFNQLHCHPRKLIWIDERLKPVSSIQDLVLEHRDVVIPEIGDVSLNIRGLHRDVIEPLPATLQEAVDARFRVPVLHQMQPTMIWQ